MGRWGWGVSPPLSLRPPSSPPNRVTPPGRVPATTQLGGPQRLRQCSDLARHGRSAVAALQRLQVQASNSASSTRTRRRVWWCRCRSGHFQWCLTSIGFVHPSRPKLLQLLAGSILAVLGQQHLKKSVPHFVADMCSGGGVVRVSLGDKGRHPKSIVHNVYCFGRQKRDLGPVGPAPRTAGELSFASS